MPDHDGIPRPVLAASALAKPDPAAPRPENALDRAIGAAERRLRAMMTAADWPGRDIDLIAGPISEITVCAAWRVFKQEVSAWNRQHQ